MFADEEPGHQQPWSAPDRIQKKHLTNYHRYRTPDLTVDLKITRSCFWCQERQTEWNTPAPHNTDTDRHTDRHTKLCCAKGKMNHCISERQWWSGPLPYHHLRHWWFSHPQTNQWGGHIPISSCLSDRKSMPQSCHLTQWISLRQREFWWIFKAEKFSHTQVCNFTEYSHYFPKFKHDIVKKNIPLFLW